MLKLKNMKEFYDEVEKLVKNNDLLYVEAVVEHLKNNGIEIESAKARNLIGPPLKRKILKEAKKYNMLRKKK